MKKDFSRRLQMIDTLRGFALLNMVLFHFFYDIFMVYGLDPKWGLHIGTIVWERFICVSFILLSGVSLHFSKHAYRRGLIVNACGLLVTLVTAVAMPGQAVWFGVLNLIGCSMLIATSASSLSSFSRCPAPSISSGTPPSSAFRPRGSDRRTISR